MKETSSIKSYYTTRLQRVIDKYTHSEDKIFVLLGISSIIDIDKFKSHIVDPITFCVDANDKIFTKDWFVNIFGSVTKKTGYKILSYAQFCYLTQYVSVSFFQEDVVVIKDNLRHLFPIRNDDFIEFIDTENTETRPDSLPIYQAEQFRINDTSYYTVQMPDDDILCEDLFSERTPLKSTANIKDGEFLDILSYEYAIDLFVNECLQNNDLSKHVIVKAYSKQPYSELVLSDLQRLNFILSEFGGEILMLEDVAIESDHIVSDLADSLLKKYWSETAEFRNLNVYKNPNINKELVSVSQGLIVDNIINEYENAKKGKPVKDLFLTAPTGAGKSLLFQLPAFHVSECGDMTIIVSPLIALMKDQVNAIIQDRHFERVRYINSELSLLERDQIINDCKYNEIDVLYLSPELLLSYDISFFIGERRLGLIVIDEAHLITTWGRDFRVDYWYLGNYIRKIRKYKSYNFPMVAVTATAVYGGVNDMVFDSIDSLVMQNPYIFIGQVKRDDITFVINNYEQFQKSFEHNKISQTADFIRKIYDLGLKTIVYAPYTRHIQQLMNALEQDENESERIAVSYYGTLEQSHKDYAYKQFLSGESSIMICTKAFGMGVDISDIQVVYHHAPSGLLPDYVQEIGRVARKADLHGFAALNYSSKDLHASKALHGLSSIKLYQLKEVLKKIHKIFVSNHRRRNLLVSADDFGYIFDDFNEDQKVLTALMMIEKDYLAKYRFNVLIARPKKLFSKVFARIPESDLFKLDKHYKGSYKIISTAINNSKNIELDLDFIWSNFHNEKSFPALKAAFYSKDLFKEYDIDVNPVLKFSFEISKERDSIYEKLSVFFDVLKSIFSSMEKFFKPESFKKQLKEKMPGLSGYDDITKFILMTFSRLTIQGHQDDYAFLQDKGTQFGHTYRVIGCKYLAAFDSLLRLFAKMFENEEIQNVNRFVTKGNSISVSYLRLGYFMEMLNVGTFEVKGGENPMIFIRINDPFRIERDANSQFYTNSLLEKTLNKFDVSNKVFDHFFLNDYSNEERWNFIEDFFLGADVDTLDEVYPTTKPNSKDVIEEIGTLLSDFQTKGLGSTVKSSKPVLYYPKSREYYDKERLVTLDKDSEPKTMTVISWIQKEPRFFYEQMVERDFYIQKEQFKYLMSKLREIHPDYYIKISGLGIYISLPGDRNTVAASHYYQYQPVKFYKWWCKNQNKVFLTLKEKIQLVIKVNSIEPSAIINEHRQYL